MRLFLGIVNEKFSLKSWGVTQYLVMPWKIGYKLSQIWHILQFFPFFKGRKQQSRNSIVNSTHTYFLLVFFDRSMRKFQLHIDITFYIQSDFFTSTTCWSAFLAHISAQNMISKNKNSREIIRIISKCNQTRRTISLGTLKCGCKIEYSGFRF